MTNITEKVKAAKKINLSDELLRQLGYNRKVRRSYRAIMRKKGRADAMRHISQGIDGIMAALLKAHETYTQGVTA